MWVDVVRTPTLAAVDACGQTLDTEKCDPSI
jgi:hypothetical protein